MNKKYIYALFFFAILISCKKEEVKNVIEVTSVKSYTYKELKPLLTKNDGKTYVVNFWATWCAPCVKELPYFEKLREEYIGKDVEVILVSLDFPKQIDKRLIPFINKKQLKSNVIVLNDVNEDVWIKDIDSTWSGALPATLIYSKKGRKFFEQSFEYEELEKELQSLL
ncbi:TlpA family protein disulfide reductase [Polaribacter sp. Z022]|uniref:TlpA family protein disulfide reductase n=1 Tax=Polaribacter sp. Z022 TaxID=2927125 RepID=UPI0020204263|nr:TlpA family protein disulfide reductase [Polaribacter sp. Z022]MCL7753520.1 TlpA family protein disulfide reductase [Polaribacter sp. Z022]